MKTVYTSESDKTVGRVSCKYFVTNLLDLNKDIKRTISDKDSFVVYICMEGEASLTDNDGNNINIRQGETILVPAAIEWVKFGVQTKVKLLECYIPKI